MAISPALETSPFGRLSTELRLMIWEFALHREDGVRFNHRAASHARNEKSNGNTSSETTTDGLELSVYPLDDEPLTAERSPSIMSLAQTCKQIRYEATPVFLEMNSFHALCPIFDNSKGHGEICPEATRCNQQQLQSWLQILHNDDESWPSRIRRLTIDLGVWRICGCKSSSQSFVDAVTGFSAVFPPLRNRILRVQFQVQWRAICPCCESDTNDESVWPLAFELERGNHDKFFEAVMEVCQGRASWILEKAGLCGRTRMAWLVQLERASGRLVEIFRLLERSGREWEGCEDVVEEVEVETASE